MSEGRLSIFGGPNDPDMAETDGLDLYEHAEADKRPDLFFPRDLSKPAQGTSKRLRPRTYYIALRFDHKERSRQDWQKTRWLIKNNSNGRFGHAYLVDWGPAEHTGRSIDMSPGLAQKLEVQTDDTVEWVELVE